MGSQLRRWRERSLGAFGRRWRSRLRRRICRLTRPWVAVSKFVLTVEEIGWVVGFGVSWNESWKGENTSGTPEIVVVDVSHVTALWMLSTESWTSAGRATEPITKQAVARREVLSVGAEKTDAKSVR